MCLILSGTGLSKHEMDRHHGSSLGKDVDKGPVLYVVSNGFDTDEDIISFGKQFFGIEEEYLTAGVESLYKIRGRSRIATSVLKK
jgi:hypothetical protein